MCDFNVCASICLIYATHEKKKTQYDHVHIDHCVCLGILKQVGVSIRVAYEFVCFNTYRTLAYTHTRTHTHVRILFFRKKATISEG